MMSPSAANGIALALRPRLRYGFRWVVFVQRYSLETGEVGKFIEGPQFISQHKSVAAAGRMLGSMISGKRRKLVPAGGCYLAAINPATGQILSRNDCRNIVQDGAL